MIVLMHKVRFSTIGCTETKCWWTILTAFFFLSKAKVLAKLSAFSISSTFIRQVFSAWASIFQIVSLTENLHLQTGRVISDVSVPCFAGDRETILKSPLNICLSTTYITKSNFITERDDDPHFGSPFLSGGSPSLSVRQLMWYTIHSGTKFFLKSFSWILRCHR